MGASFSQYVQARISLLQTGIVRQRRGSGDSPARCGPGFGYTAAPLALTVDQILAMAPDAAAAAAGRSLAAPSKWRGLGQSDAALWGECQGSALYQVRVDRSDLVAKCSCPSRKFPCKHALGLLFLAAQEQVPGGDPPEWVRDWLEKRADGAVRKQARKAASEAPPDPEARARRAEKRLERVLGGLDMLDLWLADLARAGIASLEGRPPGFFEQMAARLVDAQAPGLASRVRRIADRVGGEATWPQIVLDELGMLALVSRSFRRIESLEEPLRADLRRLVGFTLEKEEVAASGNLLEDAWAVVGQHVFDDERFRTQRTWLLGRQSGRRALVLQFAAGRAAFPEALLPGSVVEAKLAFWPSAYPQRALVQERRATLPSLGDRLPGFETAEAFLDDVSTALAAQPWLDRFCCLLRDATPRVEDAGFSLRDGRGVCLPLAGHDHWKLLALSGGRPVDVCGEWDGRALHPLSAAAEGGFHALRSEG